MGFSRRCFDVEGLIEPNPDRLRNVAYSSPGQLTRASRVQATRPTLGEPRMITGHRRLGAAILIYLGVTGFLMSAAMGATLMARAGYERRCAGTGGWWDAGGGRCEARNQATWVRRHSENHRALR